MNSLESFARFMPVANNIPNHSAILNNANILTDVEAKANIFTNSLNDCLYEVTNEPSMGFYRIQEHVRKSVSTVIEKSNELNTFCTKLKGSSFDLDYSLDAIVKMSRADTTLESIQNILTNSLYTARQLNVRNMRISSSSETQIPFSQAISPPKPKVQRARDSLINLISTRPSKTTENLSKISSNPSRSQTMIISNEAKIIVSDKKESPVIIKEDIPEAEPIKPSRKEEEIRSQNSSLNTSEISPEKRDVTESKIDNSENKESEEIH